MGYRAHVVKKIEISETGECFFNWMSSELYEFLDSCNINIYSFSGNSCSSDSLWQIDNSISEIKELLKNVEEDVHKAKIEAFFANEGFSYEDVKSEIVSLLEEIVDNCNDTDGIHLFWY